MTSSGLSKFLSNFFPLVMCPKRIHTHSVYFQLALLAFLPFYSHMTSLVMTCYNYMDGFVETLACCMLISSLMLMRLTDKVLNLVLNDNTQYYGGNLVGAIKVSKCDTKPHVLIKCINALSSVQIFPLLCCISVQ